MCGRKDKAMEACDACEGVTLATYRYTSHRISIYTENISNLFHYFVERLDLNIQFCHLNQIIIQVCPQLKKNSINLLRSRFNHLLQRCLLLQLKRRELSPLLVEKVGELFVDACFPSKNRHCAKQSGK